LNLHRCLKSVKPGLNLHGRIMDDLTDLMAGVVGATLTPTP